MLAFARKDLLAIIINASKKSGGAAIQNDIVIRNTNTAARVIPRIVYGLVFVSFLVVLVLVLVSAGSGGAIIPAL